MCLNWSKCEWYLRWVCIWGYVWLNISYFSFSSFIAMLNEWWNYPDEFQAEHDIWASWSGASFTSYSQQVSSIYTPYVCMNQLHICDSTYWKLPIVERLNFELAESKYFTIWSQSWFWRAFSSKSSFHWSVIMSSMKLPCLENAVSDLKHFWQWLS